MVSMLGKMIDEEIFPGKIANADGMKILNLSEWKFYFRTNIVKYLTTVPSIHRFITDLCGNDPPGLKSL
jgi:hypothetical protein